MDFTTRLLKRDAFVRTKLEPINENYVSPRKDVQHNIVTTISSTSVDLKNRGNNKVTIETTVSLSKLPSLSPSHPIIEVISDGTTSSDVGSESSDEKENENPKQQKSFPCSEIKSRLQQLGAMYTGDPEIVNMQRTEDRFTSGEPSEDRIAHRTKPTGRSARLAALADTINSWEDDPRHFPVGKEAQGFSRSVSNQRLIYYYNEEENPSSLVKLPSPVKPPSPIKAPSPEKVTSPMKSPLENTPSPHKKSPIRATSPVKGRYGSPIQMGITLLKGTNNKQPVPLSSDEEWSAPVMGVKQLRNWCKPQLPHTSSVVTSPMEQPRDPAELSLAERMALFERNPGQAVLPKASFAMPVPCSKLHNKLSGTDQKSTYTKSSQQPSSGPLRDRLAVFEKGLCEKTFMGESSQTQLELDLLKQRWNRNKELAKPVKDDFKHSRPPSPPPLPSPPQPFEYGRARGSGYGYFHNEEDQPDSCQQQTKPGEEYSTLKEVKKVRFSPPKDGCLYSDLSDVDVESEAVVSEMEHSDSNRSQTSTSSRELDMCSSDQNYVEMSKSNLKREWSSESFGVEGNEVDDFLEEALDSSSDETSPPKRSSYSALKPVTPIRHVEINPSYSDESFDQTDDVMDEQLVKEKIERLQQEDIKQQSYISQAIQALNLCYSTFEFSGSTEQLEAEKLLLLASLRRQGFLQEIQRLKVEGRLYPGEPSLTDRGSLTVSHVTLPLKMDVVHHAAKDDECYYLLCVVRRNEEVLCSDIMSARRSLHGGNKITFPNKFTVRDLYNDFKIVVEFYAMKARHKELIPHDIKYHINKNKKEVSKLRLTPRKAKGDPKLVAQSPTASAFTLAGYLVFSLREIHRTQFTLSKSKNTYNNVVEGTVQLQLETEMRVDVEYQGFLTMFEDVSGLGAWHRRWFLLKGDKLSYWKYPDDEKKKIPLDTIELSQCTSKEVEVVRRDVCARPNTLQLLTVRPARHTDTVSLVLTRRGDRTCVRHWLSADTREERDQWCHHLNKTLALMRAWGVSTAL